MNRTEAFNLIAKKQGDVSAAGLFVDDLGPVEEKRDGSLDLGLPSSRKQVDLGTEPLNKAESKLVQAYLNELAAQEQDHINLTNACKKVISAYEKSMERIAEMEFPELQEPQPAPEQVPYSQWEANGQKEGGDVAEEAEDEPELKAKNKDNAAAAASGASSSNRKRGRPSHVCLPKEAINVLKEWLYSHAKYPYPSQADKEAMAEDTKLSIKQINNWFINARRRYLTNEKKVSKCLFRSKFSFINFPFFFLKTDKKRRTVDEAEEWVE